MIEIVIIKGSIHSNGKQCLIYDRKVFSLTPSHHEHRNKKIVKETKSYFSSFPRNQSTPKKIHYEKHTHYFEDATIGDIRAKVGF